MTLQATLEGKLADQLLELKLLVFSPNCRATDLQRLFGICLGLRYALAEVTGGAGYRHASLLFDLIRERMDEAGPLEWRRFPWPDLSAK